MKNFHYLAVEQDWHIRWNASLALSVLVWQLGAPCHGRQDHSILEGHLLWFELLAKTRKKESFYKLHVQIKFIPQTFFICLQFHLYWRVYLSFGGATARLSEDLRASIVLFSLFFTSLRATPVTIYRQLRNSASFFSRKFIAIKKNWWGLLDLTLYVNCRHSYLILYNLLLFLLLRLIILMQLNRLCFHPSLYLKLEVRWQGLMDR